MRGTFLVLCETENKNTTLCKFAMHFYQFCNRRFVPINLIRLLGLFTEELYSSETGEIRPQLYIRPCNLWNLFKTGEINTYMYIGVAHNETRYEKLYYVPHK